MKKILSLTILILYITNICHMVNAEFTKEYLNDPNCLPDYRMIICKNGNVNIYKPTAQFSIKNLTTGESVISYAGKECNDPFPEVKATVGDTLKFSDLSEPHNSIISWDFQYYGSEGDSYKVYNTSINGKEIKLTKAGKTTYYLAVLRGDKVTSGMQAWSDNGNHQTIGPKTASFPKGLFWYFTAITVNIAAAPSTPKPSTPKPSTPTPIVTPVPPNGIIKFDPPSCEWRNTDLNVRIYVDGNKSTNTLDSAIRKYNNLGVDYSTFWTFNQTWRIGQINATSKFVNKQINDNDTVTINNNGVGKVNASLVGWLPGTKSWLSGNPPLGTWNSGQPSTNSLMPSERYDSSSGTYKIDKTNPTITFDWSKQDWFKDNKHGFIYLPDNKINATFGDNLSGVVESRYAWTKNATFPNISAMDSLGLKTDEEKNDTVTSSILVHDKQDRVNDWYLHIYLKDRAGNVTKATERIFIECSLQNFRITDITDRKWENVFWNPDFKTGKPTYAYYPVNMMPVDLHPTKKILPKKGYAFYFNMTSKGLNENADTVVIKPRFYYLKDLTNASIKNSFEVDLYYDLGKEYLIQYGSTRDHFNMNYKMANNTYVIGGLTNLTLDKNVRTITDTKNSKWFGRFALMATTKAVKKGTPIVVNGKVNNDALLTKGCILINFTIEGYKKGNKVFDYNPDQWTIEGGPKDKNLFYTGDTIIFDLSHSALDDYGTGTDR